MALGNLDDDAGIDPNDPRLAEYRKQMEEIRAREAQEDQESPVDNELLKGYFKGTTTSEEVDHVHEQILEQPSWLRAVSKLLDDREITPEDIRERNRKDREQSGS